MEQERTHQVKKTLKQTLKHLIILFAIWCCWGSSKPASSPTSGGTAAKAEGPEEKKEAAAPSPQEQ